MKRRPSVVGVAPDEALAVYADRPWSDFVDWCRRNHVDPLEVLRESARRKRGVS